MNCLLHNLRLFALIDNELIEFKSECLISIFHSKGVLVVVLEGLCAEVVEADDELVGCLIDLWGDVLVVLHLLAVEEEL
jgi:hypothetical protein